MTTKVKMENVKRINHLGDLDKMEEFCEGLN
jgi:hypothetical protein